MQQSKKIAIIDDDRVFQMIIEHQLASGQLDCDTMKFSNGRSAMNFLKENTDQIDNIPDLVFLDLNMPVQSGWKFLEEYKNIPEKVKKKVHLYVLTSSVLKSDVERASDIDDIIGFISKPMSNEKLQEVYLSVDA